MIGTFISYLGTEMQNFVMSLYVLTETGSSVLFSIIIACNFLPHVLFGGIAGVIADRFDKKMIIVLADILSGVTTLIFFVLIFLFEFNFILIAFTVFLLSVINTFFTPAVRSTMPLIVEKTDLVKANSIDGIVVSAGRLLAPMLAGVLISFVDVSVILLINGCSFLISAFSENYMTIVSELDKTTKHHIKTMKEDLKEGILYVKETKLLKTVIVISGCMNLFIMPIFAISIPYVIKVVLNYSDKQFALSETILMIGVMVGMYLLNILNKKIKLEQIFKMGIYSLFAVIASIGLLLLLDIRNTMFIYTSLLLLNFLMGMCVVFFEVSSMVLMQQTADKDKIGRVIGLFGTLKNLAMLIGQFGIAIFLELISPGNVIIFVSILILILGLVSSISLKSEEIQQI